MRLSVEQLTPFGDDGVLIHFVDTAFLHEDPDRVGVAVSGGGDSMALLHAAKCRADLAGTVVEAVTVNHGLRAEAADEAAMVAQYCADHDIPHTTLQWDGSAATGNIAAAGRDARYQLIADWAKARGVGGVLLGHTQDDVAETFLMRLARKSGVDGLSLMEGRFYRHGIEWSRPFWQQTREGLRDYLRRHDVPWVDDPTNDDESYDRPKARKILAALAPLGIDSDVLKSVALNMTSASTALYHYACEEARKHVTVEAGDVLLPIRLRPPIPPETERRLLRAALQYVSGSKYPPRESALIQLEMTLLSQDRHTVGGCLVSKEDKTLRVSREHSACEGDVAWPNRLLSKLWDGRWLVSEEKDVDYSGNLTIRALGNQIKDVPDWRETGLPRSSLMATPAVFDGGTLIAAPVAGLQNGFEARIVADLQSFLLSR